ncbi:MAG TPA: SH3 domain-containing protein, partial [Phycisphaerae bacterium]|nr:SH3 domain-containing protein [Phycisphaerae bacterium]
SSAPPSSSAATAAAATLVPAATATAPLWTPPSTAAAASAPASPAEAAFTQPFVGSVAGDRVYVRSGPDKNAYEIGQLTKNDLVYVVGAVKGWYQILPPNGSFCLIAKEYVELDPGNATGTVKGDYINVRAGTAIYKTRDSSVMTTLRKGTKLKVLGSTDTYYQIAPPEKVYFYITPQYVKAAVDTAYKVPDLKLPQGVTGPSGVTVEAPTTLPTTMATLILPETMPGGAATTPATAVAVATGPTIELPGTAPATQPQLPPLVPAVKFSETATARFNDVNARYQAEAKKAVADQNLNALLAEFKEILAMENVAPSVQAGAQADIAAIDRTMTVQRLMKEQQAAQESTRKQTDALQEQYEAAQRAIAAARTAGPYSAEGLLQTSTIVQGKYALVNPTTSRVVAYVDPGNSSIDLSIFIGKYIGVRGITKTMENSDVKVIQVSNATLMPTPEAGKPEP